MDKKLILTFTKSELIDVLKSFAESNQIKLRNDDRFKEQFNSVSQNITSISYGYPLGFTGAIKYLTNFFINLRMDSYESNPQEIEIYTSAVNELIDRGIAPYLKMLYSGGSYSYAAEKGLMASKGNLIIKELSSQEKLATEDFWDNIEEWMMEKEKALYPSDYYYNPNSSYNNPSTSYSQPAVVNKPEIPGSYEITNLKLNGGNNSVVVAPGQTIPINLSYSVWSRTGCPGCIIQLVLGIGDNASGCVYNDIPGIYPGRSGNYSTTVSAPQNPGTYYLYMSYAAQYSCSNAMELYLPIIATKIGTVVVSP